MTNIKKFWNNYKVYVLLCIICIIIRIIPCSVGKQLDDAINDIAIGGLASTIVAWIIQVNDIAKRQEIVKRISKNAMKDVLRFTYNYLFFFCYISTYYGNVPKTESKSFDEWFEIGYEILDKGEFIREKVNDFYMTQIKNMIETLKKILDDLDWYMLEGVLSEEDTNLVKNLYEVFNCQNIIITGKNSLYLMRSLHDAVMLFIKNNGRTKTWVSKKVTIFNGYDYLG